MLYASCVMLRFYSIRFEAVPGQMSQDLAITLTYLLENMSIDMKYWTYAKPHVEVVFAVPSHEVERYEEIINTYVSAISVPVLALAVQALNGDQNPNKH